MSANRYKTVWIIGATSGIGHVLAQLFAAAGSRVFASGRRVHLLENLQQEFPETLDVFAHDVNVNAATDTVLEKIMGRTESLDLIVHCSGIGEENPPLEWETEAATLQTNVLAATYIYGLAFKLFSRQGHGHLAAISSIAALRGNRHAPAYFASKAFQVNYLESLYLKTKEIKGGKIYITDIRPGFVDTKMALGNEIFWLVPLPKAARQIFRAILRKKRVVYVSHRWRLIAFVLKIVPSSWIKFFK